MEDEAKSDQEKLIDVLEGYKQRKAEVARAALENCALEQGEVSECFKTGGWMKRMTMCREENRGFERCYVMQSVCSRLFFFGMPVASIEYQYGLRHPITPHFF